MPTPATSSSPKPRPSKLDPYLDLLGARTDAEVAAISGLTTEAVRQYRKRRGIPSAAEAQAAGSGEELPPEPGETVAEPAVAAPVATTTSRATKTKQKAAVAPKATTSTKGKNETAKPETKPAKKGEEPNREAAPPTTAKPAARASRGARIESVRHLIGVLPDAEVAAQAGVSQTAIMIYRESRKIPGAGPAPAAETAPNRSSDTAPDDLPTEPSEPAPVTAAEPEPEPKKQATRAKATPTPSAPGRVRRRRGDQVEDIEGRAPAMVPEPEPEPERETTVRSKPGRKSADALLEPFRSQLGTVDDGAIAEMAGVSRGVVGAYRRKHQINAYDGYLWTGGSGTAGRVRRAEQTTAGGGSGKAPPAAAAVVPTTTSKPKPSRKQKAAAPAVPTAPVEPPKRRGPPSKLDAVRHLVGVLGDGEVAERVGLTRSAVQMYRRKHDIPAPTKRVVPPVGLAAEAPAAPTTKARGARREEMMPPASAVQVSSEVAAVLPVAVAPSRPLIAWKLTLRVGGVEVEKYAITTDSASVGRIADAAGEVLRIERVGDGLM